MNYFDFAVENARRQAAFGTPGNWPNEIAYYTADDIILAALCQYFGGDALEKQEPGDPDVVRALDNMDALAEVFWLRGPEWDRLTNLIKRGVNVIRNATQGEKAKNGPSL